jgi:hypothetical protein
LRRLTLLGAACSFAQLLNLVGEQRTPAVQQIGSKKPAAAGYKGAARIRHTATLTGNGAIRFAIAPYNFWQCATGLAQLLATRTVSLRMLYYYSSAQLARCEDSA